MIFTKHFSKFQFCRKHGITYDTPIFAEVSQKIESANDLTLVSLKVILQTSFALQKVCQGFT